MDKSKQERSCSGYPGASATPHGNKAQGAVRRPDGTVRVRKHQQVVMKHVLDQDLRMDLKGEWQNGDVQDRTGLKAMAEAALPRLTDTAMPALL